MIDTSIAERGLSPTPECFSNVGPEWTGLAREGVGEFQSMTWRPLTMLHAHLLESRNWAHRDPENCLPWPDLPQVTRDGT